MVAADDGGTDVRQVVRAVDVEPGVAHEPGTGERHGDLLQLDPDDRQLLHALGHVEVQRSATGAPRQPPSTADRG